MAVLGCIGGSPKSGWRTSRRRIERLMRAAGLRARVATIYMSKASLRRVFARNPNLLWKHCAKEPNRVWVSDVTYLSVAGTWRYLAVVMDQNSRRIVGWSLGRGRGVSLTRAAFDQAMRRRRPSR